MAEVTSAPPLTGLRVVELAGLAPGPFATLLLASLGASVLRIDRPPHPTRRGPPAPDLLTAHKASLALDLAHPRGRALLLALLARADVLLDPFRPGALERLGLAPAALRARNPRLIVARLTGFRRDGPYARRAGHDVNYLAVSGVLSSLGPKGAPPAFPANLLADFAGGALVCALGVLAAVVARERTGRGQVVEANMVDGVSALASALRLARRTPVGDRPRGENLLDGGCPWYAVYETKDGRYVAVGALEPQFFRELVKGLGLPAELLETRMDRSRWPSMRKQLQDEFKQRTRKEWEGVFDGTDACVTPVLELDEMEEDGYEQRPAIGLSETPARADSFGWRSEGLAIGEGGPELLHEWMGWTEGREYENMQGALLKKESAKL